MLKDQRFHGSSLHKGHATSSRPKKVDYTRVTFRRHNVTGSRVPYEGHLPIRDRARVYREDVWICSRLSRLSRLSGA